MHLLFLLSALLLATAVGAVGAGLLRLLPRGGRRSLALVVLAAPPSVLALGTTHVVPRFWAACAPATGWDLVASVALLSVIGGTGLVALGLSLARLLLVERLLRACRPATDRALLVRLSVLAGRLGIVAPAVRVLRLNTPLAVSGGLLRPTIVLSAWLLDRLDDAELEAVLTHELAHLARRDHFTRWLGRLLRDATVYLPSSWYALRALEADEELGADALGVGITRQPRAMASALAKVWRGVVDVPAPRGLASVPGYGAASAALLENRLQLLLEPPRRRPWAAGRVLAGAGALSVGGVAPRLLAASAAALPLVCTARPG